MYTYSIYIYIYSYIYTYVCSYVYTHSIVFYLYHTPLISYPMIFPESYELIFSHHSHTKPSCRRCSRSRNGTSMATLPRCDQLDILGHGCERFPYISPIILPSLRCDVHFNVDNRYGFKKGTLSTILVGWAHVHL